MKVQRRASDNCIDSISRLLADVDSSSRSQHARQQNAPLKVSIGIVDYRGLHLDEPTQRRAAKPIWQIGTHAGGQHHVERLRVEGSDSSRNDVVATRLELVDRGLVALDEML